MKEYLELTHFQMERLFCFKQRLLNSSRNNSGAIKPHGVYHFIYEMTQTASLSNTDTRAGEQKHKGIKHAWKSSSRRQGYPVLREVFERLETSRVIDKANDLFEDIYGHVVVDRVTPKKVRTIHTLYNGNLENVKFECSILNSDKEELIYDFRKRTLISLFPRALQFLNPLISLESVWEYLQNFDEITAFIDNFKSRTHGKNNM